MALWTQHRQTLIQQQLPKKVDPSLAKPDILTAVFLPCFLNGHGCDSLLILENSRRIKEGVSQIELVKTSCDVNSVPASVRLWDGGRSGQTDEGQTLLTTALVL